LEYLDFTTDSESRPMSKPSSQFIVSIEAECLTAVPENPAEMSEAVEIFLKRLALHAPSLTGSSGMFNGYGKIYCDCGHIELAMVECDCPYAAALIFERLQTLASRAVADLSARGIHLVLANNNHSGRLQDGCAVWGTHENYLTEQHPSSFTDEILPFLVTRIYGGSGGVHFPSGDFLASVRSTCMVTASGGATTESRAIHSLARDEHHMGLSPGRYRYHLLLGDGHRSQFNLALQLGATALAIKAAMFDCKLRRQLARLRRQFSEDWVATLHDVNVLSRHGQPVIVHPLVVTTQRLYLEAARRVVRAMDKPPEWVPRLLEDWQQTLLAYERQDRAWLASRMDAFAKYEFYTAVLNAQQCSWAELPRRERLFDELSLLDQSYHEFCCPGSVFRQLERTGLLNHRVGPLIEPGRESDPYIPEVATRAKPRAIFIRDHRNRPEFTIDWSYIQDNRRRRVVHLEDPFAQELGEWVPAIRRRRSLGIDIFESPTRDEILQVYDHGRYEEAHALLLDGEMAHQLHGVELPDSVRRQKAWVHARCGLLDGERLLAQVYREPPTSLIGITDYCHVIRFVGLCPRLERILPWIERGRRLLRTNIPSGDVEQAAIFREHAAVAFTRNGRTDEALDLLEPALAEPARGQTSLRSQAQLLATLGETYRRIGRIAEARQALDEAARIQVDRDYAGYLSYCTWLSLAKSEASPESGVGWLERALAIQRQNRDRVAIAATLLLEARLSDNSDLADANRNRVLAIRNQLPALRECPTLSRIVDHWDAWINCDQLDLEREDFWGL
jgi:tetratricopeptide (TPR) repeat protein